ncbi:hypothetical protein [Salidesulfovibrio onnuriiensis]|uniref:hypothetical protein n=1 Tax=Salidesulfovibrio onnuriiensis TaxID=2583823 RepID=UPI0011C9C399|nr:hypothetical protein [Salidesulfovibrio onnuriiensis]
MKGKQLLLTIFTLILFLPLSVTAGDFVQNPAPEKFRDMAFGASLESLTDLVPVPKAGYKDTYYRKDEKLTFGQADILSVAYYFRKDRLYRVGVAFEGETNYFLIKDKLIRDFGPGRAVGARYGWMWPEFSMEINYDASRHQGGLYYTYEGKPQDG